jgi:hypothetical protein
MSFKVKDLAVGLPLQNDEASTCTTLTKPTGGECMSSIYWQNGASRQHNLSALRSQLRKAMSRA